MKKEIKAYLFDVDGVLFERNQEKIILDQLLIEIKKRLEQGFFVGLNTGRSFEFVSEKILIPLEKILERKFLKQIFIACEKGAVDIFYNSAHKKEVYLHKDLIIPNKIKQKIASLVELKKFNPWMFIDKSKKIMMTIEELPNNGKNGLAFKNFQEAQLSISTEIKQLILDNKLNHEIRIDQTRIAIDIESKKSGKALATKKFLEYLKTKGIVPDKVFCFGDSSSDYKMQQELKKNKIDSTFIFVGSPKTLIIKKDKKIIFPKKQLTAGVLEFLKKEN